MNILELEGIYKSYHRGGIFGGRERFQVLQDIHLAIPSGCCMGLLGRSGSGKSTLGRVALDLEAPDRGQCLFAGRPIHALGKKDYLEYRRNVQVVFQNALGSVNHRWSAGRIIAEPLANFHSPTPTRLRRQVSDLLLQVGLSPDDAHKLPHQFSGGELQRVCIARAMALNPKLIILDEAVSSLDMLIQARIIDLLQTLQKELGTAYLFISHDIRVLLKICDRLLAMRDGRIVEQVENMEGFTPIAQGAISDLVQAILPPTPTVALLHAMPGKETESRVKA
jgi:nickel transport system ATP-binding protein